MHIHTCSSHLLQVSSKLVSQVYKSCYFLIELEWNPHSVGYILNAHPFQSVRIILHNQTTKLDSSFSIKLYGFPISMIIIPNAISPSESTNAIAANCHVSSNQKLRCKFGHSSPNGSMSPTRTVGRKHTFTHFPRRCRCELFRIFILSKENPFYCVTYYYFPYNNQCLHTSETRILQNILIQVII